MLAPYAWPNARLDRACGHEDADHDGQSAHPRGCFPEALPRLRNAYSNTPGTNAWGTVLFVLEDPRILVGMGGYKGDPRAKARSRSRRRFGGRGLATDTVARLVRRALEHPTVGASMRIHSLTSTHPLGCSKGGLPANGRARGSTKRSDLALEAATPRRVQVVGTQLYATSNSTGFADVFTVGVGMPTNGPQTATPLLGVSTTNQSPFQFVLLDRDANVPGVDTLYVADDGGGGTGAGIQKYTFNGTIWTRVTTFTNGLASTGARGLTGLITGTSVTLLATTGDATAMNKIVMYVDDGNNLNPSQVVVMTAPTNTGYRGLALAP